MTLDGIRDLHHSLVPLDRELPIIFVDIDGVINAIPYERQWIGPVDSTDVLELRDPKNWQWVRVEGSSEVDYELSEEFTVEIDPAHDSPDHRFGGITPSPEEYREVTITYSPEMVNELRGFRERGDAQIVYLTWWRSEALRVLEPRLQLGAVGYLDWSSNSSLGHLRKIHAIADLYEELQLRNRFIVCDDEALRKVTPASKLWDESLPHGNELNSIERLFIEPDPRWGINRAHIESMKKFLRT